MPVLARPADARPHLEGGAVAIGNFDGVHRGHQALFATARAAASSTGRAGALTFRPHPVKVLAPHLAPPLILTYDEKLAAIAAHGVETIVELPFDRALASTAPDRFVDEVLVRGLGVAVVVVGADFSFGRGGRGKVEDLRALLAPAGADVVVVPPVMEGGLVCSSTKIREFVLEGRVEAAALLLGRPFSLTGRVVRGDGRGRGLGFPTANLETARELLPRVGVYATRAVVDGEQLPAVTNVGIRPTFQGEGVRVETHLLDRALDLYERPLEVEFVARVREERRFASVDALRAQIALDVEAARLHLGGAP